MRDPFSLVAVGLAWGLVWTIQNLRAGEWTCDVGTAKYDSIDAWGGRMAIQKDGGNCSKAYLSDHKASEWKCEAKFSFSRGSLTMTRGCLSQETTRALENGTLWTMRNNDKVDLECFVRKEEDTTLSCVTSQVPKEEGILIPSMIFEKFRSTLCNSSQIKPPWLSWFRSSGLSCPTTEEGGYHPWEFIVKANAVLPVEGDMTINKDIKIQTSGLKGTIIMRKKMMEIRLRLGWTEVLQSSKIEGREVRVRVGNGNYHRVVIVSVSLFGRVDAVRVEQEGRSLVIQYPR